MLHRRISMALIGPPPPLLHHIHPHCLIKNIRLGHQGGISLVSFYIINILLSTDSFLLIHKHLTRKNTSFDTSSHPFCSWLVTKLYPTLSWPQSLWSSRALRSWDFPGRNSGVGYCFLPQGIFLTQGWNPPPLHWLADSLPLNHQGSPPNYLPPFSFSEILSSKIPQKSSLYFLIPVPWFSPTFPKSGFFSHSQKLSFLRVYQSPQVVRYNG